MVLWSLIYIYIVTSLIINNLKLNDYIHYSAIQLILDSKSKLKK